MKFKIVAVVMLIVVLFWLPLLIGGYRKKDSRRDEKYRVGIERLTSGLFRGFRLRLEDIDTASSTHDSCRLNRKNQLEVRARCGDVTRFTERKRRFCKASLTLVEGGPCTVQFRPAKSRSGEMRPMPVSKDLYIGGPVKLEFVLLAQGGSLLIEPCADGGMRKFILR